MTDADEMAQRYLALWREYLTALLADPRTLETLKRWATFAGQFSYPGGKAPAEGAPVPAWPPFFGPFGPMAAPTTPAATSPAADSSETITALTERIDALERRLTALEQRAKPRRPRRGARTTGR